jgi:hypothetical protein
MFHQYPVTHVIRNPVVQFGLLAIKSVEVPRGERRGVRIRYTRTLNLRKAIMCNIMYRMSPAAGVCLCRRGVVWSRQIMVMSSTLSYWSLHWSLPIMTSTLSCWSLDDRTARSCHFSAGHSSSSPSISSGEPVSFGAPSSLWPRRLSKSCFGSFFGLPWQLFCLPSPTRTFPNVVAPTSLGGSRSG